jgi:hypothetical protein
VSENYPRSSLSFKSAAVVAVALAAAVSAAGAALAAPTAHPAQSASSLVPLRQVGLGWSIVEYSAAKVSPPTKGKTTLYAVSPQGRRFAFYSWPAAKPSLSSFFLVDWSGDGQRVLVVNGFNRYEQISLATGKIINTFKLPSSASAQLHKAARREHPCQLRRRRHSQVRPARKPREGAD